MPCYCGAYDCPRCYIQIPCEECGRIEYDCECEECEECGELNCEDEECEEKKNENE